MTRREYNDADSRAIFALFQNRLKDLLKEISPRWDMHHMTIERRTDHRTMGEEVVIRLVIREDAEKDGLNGPLRDFPRLPY